MDVLSTYFSPSSRVGGPAVAKGKAARQRLPASPQRLVPLFFVWKLILLVCVALSPGSGYDTSSRIFLDAGSSSAANRVHHSWLVSGIEHLVLRLTRWDAIYFTSAASHGKIYEQEWAFSFVLSRFTSWIATVLFWPFSISSLVKSALAGILISNLSHLLAVLVLYRLIYEVVPASPIRKRLLAFTTAGLHIISPAGVFLCAPYGESTFALFNFLGMLSYVFAAQARFSDAQHAKVPRHARMQEASWTVTAGLCFAIASTIRGNGLLSGIMFAWDVVARIPMLPKIVRSVDEMLRIAPTLLAGALLALGFAFPQIVAYLEYCTTTVPRPWCSAFPPSIYSFVQSHYWNVGFLRYWTFSNLPLFALAMPLGCVMLDSAMSALLNLQTMTLTARGQPNPTNTSKTTREQLNPSIAEDKVFRHVLPRFAAPQLVLVVLAATSFHVQILNRISSGYPLWYFGLAVAICNAGSTLREDSRILSKYVRLPFKVTPEILLRSMVGYAMVQGGLYAAFLPPA
nr:gpi mannosyltransferase 2 [Quercus suber]